MKRALLLLNSATGLLYAAEDKWELNNVFTLYGDYACFRRELALKHGLVIDSSKSDCNCQFQRCTTKEIVHRFGFESGFKVGSTYMTHHTVWDVFYLWLPPWHAHCDKESSTGSLIFSVKHPDMTEDFDGADRGRAEYTSQFQNTELDFYRYSAPRHGDIFAAAWMVGLRYMSVRESVDIALTKGSNTSSYKVHTENHIPAVQVGGLIGWNPTRQISWDMVVKVGVGFDWGEQKTRLGDLNNTVVVRDYEKSGFSTPLVAEAGITLSYQPTSFLDLHVAYQAIYLNGVALAPDQLVKKRGGEHVYRAIGAELIHGVTAGIGWSF